MNDALTAASSRSLWNRRWVAVAVACLLIAACGAKVRWIWDITISGAEINDHVTKYGSKLVVTDAGTIYTLHQHSDNNLHTLQKFATDGNRQWSVSDIGGWGLDLIHYPGDANHSEQLHLITVDSYDGVVWRVLDSDGHALHQRDIPAELLPMQTVLHYHLADPDTLLVTGIEYTPVSIETSHRYMLYAITVDGVQPLYQAPYAVTELTVQTDATGNLYLTGVGAEPWDGQPSFVVKMNAAYETLWEVSLPTDVRVDRLNRPVLSANGDLHLLEFLPASPAVPGRNVRTIDALTGSMRVLTLPDTNGAEFLGAAADADGIYILSRRSVWDDSDQEYLYQWSILHLADDGALSTVIPVSDASSRWPQVLRDTRNGFMMRTIESKVLARYQGGISKESYRFGVDLYGFDGLLKRNIQAEAVIHTKVNGSVVRVHQIGENFIGMQQDASGALYALIGESWSQGAMLEPLIPDNQIHLRKY